MFTRIVLSSLVVAAIATSAVQAAPLKLNEYKAIDRWVEIFHPEELVGPPVDPSGPLHKAEIVAFDPQPEPPHVEVVIIAVKR